jgi:transposase
MYKRRDSVEKRFHTFKGTLNADSSYLRDNVSAYGHIFVSFLSMYILARLEDRIRDAGLLNRYSVEDVLTEYSKSYAVRTDDGMLDYEVPKRLGELDRKLGLGIFPILRS